MSTQHIVQQPAEEVPVDQTMHIQQPAMATLIPVIEKDVAEKIPGYRCIHGRHVGPTSGDIPLPVAKRFTIGRTTATSDLYLNYPDVSRAHAAIQYSEGMFTVTDLDSLNGTWLNEKRIASQRPQLLQSGDLLRFGEWGIFLFSLP